MKFITRVMLIVGLIFGTAMSAAPAGAAEGVPDNLVPYKTADCTVYVPPGDIVSWTDGAVYYLGESIALSPGETITLTAYSTVIDLVPTSVTFTCEGEDPDPDPNPVKPGKSKGRGPTNGLCINASAHARERVPDKVLARCNL